MPSFPLPRYKETGWLSWTYYTAQGKLYIFSHRATTARFTRTGRTAPLFLLSFILQRVVAKNILLLMYLHRLYADKLLTTRVYTQSLPVNHSPCVCSKSTKTCSSRAELGVSCSNKSQISKLNSVKLLGFTFNIKSIHNYGDKGIQEPWCTQKAGEL